MQKQDMVIAEFNLPIEYNVTDSAIAGLAEKYSNLTITNSSDYKQVSIAIGTIRDLRVNVEKKRKELKEGALVWGRKVDAEAKRITLLLEEIESPLKLTKQAWDDEKERQRLERERIEKERVSNILEQISLIKNCWRGFVNEHSDVIKKRLNLEKNIADTFDYQEFSAEAKEAKESLIIELNNLYQIACEREEEEIKRRYREELARAEAEIIQKKQLALQTELERQHKKFEEQQRIEREQLAAERKKLEEEKREIQRLAEEAKIQAQAVPTIENPIELRVPEEIKNSKLNTAVALNNTIEPHAIKESEEEWVYIRKAEYDELLEDSRFLNALIEAGVDNWSGYEDAQEIYNSESELEE
jgi:hypothetical protein